ncbi:hypothetical protein GQ44DRAFT_715938 [Phaeosphaeriaceae sp. PMI808]|nr:hypothetical protein GQ44DRAFT_715938 [Phaeosphaeriaceae sp. PMI808]
MALASAVIGCDGIKSKVRPLVCGENVEATYAGECAYRAVVPKADAEATLGLERAHNGSIYYGNGGYIITYPIEHGDFINIVAIPHDPEPPWIWKHDDWTVPTTKDAFLADFKNWFPPLIDTMAQYLLPSKWALFDLSHDRPYYKGRLCLLGDSAHATTPHLGAGAGMAMEDAFILSGLVAAVKDIGNIEEAFRAYDDVRRPRTQECIKRSLQATLGYNFMIPEIGDDVKALARLLGESFAWLWREDLEVQLETAKMSLSTNPEPVCNISMEAKLDHFVELAVDI